DHQTSASRQQYTILSRQAQLPPLPDRPRIPIDPPENGPATPSNRRGLKNLSCDLPQRPRRMCVTDSPSAWITSRTTHPEVSMSRSENAAPEMIQGRAFT